MKITAFEVRPDELPYFKELSDSMDLEIEYVHENLTIDNIESLKGSDGITVLGHSHINREILEKLKSFAIGYVSTRTIGFNHIDVQAAGELGIGIANSHYAPNGVAEFTVMHMLMALRHYKAALFRGNVNDYSLAGLQGREMRNLTVGVWGNGKIGASVIDCLQGFGCRILVHGRRENPSLEEKATHVALDQLLSESDVITLHIPLTPETHHVINRETLERMKDGVVLINTARGDLIDIEAVIEGIESRKISSLGLDVIEQEEGIYHLDRRTEIIANRGMAYLRQFPNVTMTQHMAFYTDSAVREMVEESLQGLKDFYNTGESKREVK